MYTEEKENSRKKPSTKVGHQVFVFALSVTLFVTTLGISPFRGTENESFRLFETETAYAAPYTGWYQMNGGWYYNENGYMVRNDWRRDSVEWCYLGSDGRAFQNQWGHLWDSSGLFWYWFDGNCRIVRNYWHWDTGLGYWYYMNNDAHMVTGGPHTFHDGVERNDYYFRSNGELHWKYLWVLGSSPFGGMLGWDCLYEIAYYQWNPNGVITRYVTEFSLPPEESTSENSAAYPGDEGIEGIVELLIQDPMEESESEPEERAADSPAPALAEGAMAESEDD